MHLCISVHYYAVYWCGQIRCTVIEVTASNISLKFILSNNSSLKGLNRCILNQLYFINKSRITNHSRYNRKYTKLFSYKQHASSSNVHSALAANCNAKSKKVLWFCHFGFSAKQCSASEYHFFISPVDVILPSWNNRNIWFW